MRNQIFAVGVILGLAAGGANAQELAAAATNRAASLSGASLEKVVRGAKARRAARGAAEIRAAAANLVQSGALKAQVGSRKYEWSTETHPSLPRVVLQRVIATGEQQPTSEELLAELRATQNSVTENTLVSRADAVLASLKSALRLSPDETYVAVHQGGGVLGLDDVVTGKREILVTERRVVYRRHFRGVPVIGRAGEIEIVLDTRGEAKRLEVPTDEYSASVAFTTVNGRNALLSAARGIGFDELPTSIDQEVKKNGVRVRVTDVQCGLFDSEAGEELQRGCMVRYSNTKERATTEEFVPVQ